MTNKELKFDREGRDLILSGIEKLSSAVKSTLGPRGRNVIIEGPENTIPLITKDGVTVARHVKLENNYENVGAQLVREAANKTNSSVGDGTTTSTILAEKIFKDGIKHISSGANGTLIKRGIDYAVSLVKDHLKQIAIPVSTKEDIKHIASISANGDDSIGDIISEAMLKVGMDGTVTVEEGKGVETTLKVVEGLQFDRGYLSSHFITNMASSECVLENPYILLYENSLDNIQTLLPFLQMIGKESIKTKRPILLIADNYSPEVLTTITVNKLRGSLNICVVKSPSFGNDKTAMMEDISAITNANICGDTSNKKIENITIEELGGANKVIVGKDTTTIIGGHGDEEKIKDRISHLRNLMNSTGYDVEKLKNRISKMSGGVAIISVGANTETEMHEKFHRIEDAIHATRAAIEEGIVPGGGVALIRSIDALKGHDKAGDEAIGVEIVRQALSMPLYQIVNNSEMGIAHVVVDKILNSTGNYGYDALNNIYCDMIEAGIIDPVKVTRSALENASSISGMLLTTNCVIANK